MVSESGHLGGHLAVASGLAGLAGYTLDIEHQAALTNGIVGGISVIGGLAWSGRWLAKKPIGQ